MGARARFCRRVRDDFADVIGTDERLMHADARPTHSSAAPKMPLSTFSKVDVDNIDMSEYDFTSFYYGATPPSPGQLPPLHVVQHGMRGSLPSR